MIAALLLTGEPGGLVFFGWLFCWRKSPGGQLCLGFPLSFPIKVGQKTLKLQFGLTRLNKNAHHHWAYLPHIKSAVEMRKADNRIQVFALTVSFVPGTVGTLCVEEPPGKKLCMLQTEYLWEKRVKLNFENSFERDWLWDWSQRSGKGSDEEIRYVGNKSLAAV